MDFQGDLNLLHFLSHCLLEILAWSFDCRTSDSRCASWCKVMRYSQNQRYSPSDGAISSDFITLSQWLCPHSDMSSSSELTIEILGVPPIGRREWRRQTIATWRIGWFWAHTRWPRDQSFFAIKMEFWQGTGDAAVHETAAEWRHFKFGEGETPN